MVGRVPGVIQHDNPCLVVNRLAATGGLRLSVSAREVLSMDNYYSESRCKSILNPTVCYGVVLTYARRYVRAIRRYRWDYGLSEAIRRHWAWFCGTDHAGREAFLSVLEPR